MENHREVDAPPEVVFDVLLDPWAYGHWVIGAKRIRGVDPDWPAPGSRFHHRVGVGPADTDDTSKLVEVDRPRHLVLEVRFRPVGIGVVVIDVEPVAGERSRVTMVERPVEGAVRRWWNPLLAGATLARNEWSLRRLAGLAERKPAVSEQAAEDQAELQREAPVDGGAPGGSR